MALYEVLLGTVFCLYVFAGFASVYRRYPATFWNRLHHCFWNEVYIKIYVHPLRRRNDSSCAPYHRRARLWTCQRWHRTLAVRGGLQAQHPAWALRLRWRSSAALYAPGHAPLTIPVTPTVTACVPDSHHVSATG